MIVQPKVILMRAVSTSCYDISIITQYKFFSENNCRCAALRLKKKKISEAVEIVKGSQSRTLGVAHPRCPKKIDLVLVLDGINEIVDYYQLLSRGPRLLPRAKIFILSFTWVT